MIIIILRYDAHKHVCNKKQEKQRKKEGVPGKTHNVCDHHQHCVAGDAIFLNIVVDVGSNDRASERASSRIATSAR